MFVAVGACGACAGARVPLTGTGWRGAACARPSTSRTAAGSTPLGLVLRLVHEEHSWALASWWCLGCWRSSLASVRSFGVHGEPVLHLLTLLHPGVLACGLMADPQTVLQGAQMLAQQAQAQSRAPGSAAGQGHSAQPEDEVGSFVARILGETETVWRRTLASQLGVRYQEPTLVMFAGSTRSACGFAKSAMGPFYCPRDRKVRRLTARTLSNLR